MLRYIITRLLLMVPTLLVVTLLAFFLKSYSPGDPVAAIVGFDAAEQYRSEDNYKRISYELTAGELGLDLPVFYFAIARASLPPDWYYEAFPLKKEWISELSLETGRGKEVVRLVEGLEGLQKKDGLREILKPHLYRAGVDTLVRLLERIEKEQAVSGASDSAGLLLDLAIDLKNRPKTARNFIPRFYWFGMENQYHRWLADLLRGDFGISLNSGRPVGDLITDAAWWTIWMMGTALLLIVILSIPLGVWLALRRGRPLSSAVSGALYVFYAIPLFWLATMAVVFFTTGDYGQWTNIFPSVGAYILPPEASFGERLSVLFGVLVLPIICIVLSNMAYVSIQMRNNMEEELGKKYMLMSRSKGLSQKALVWRHAFPNAMYSMITVLGGAIPALISGSVVIEVIFNINGMGRLLWNALFTQDWPVVFSVVFLAAFFTVIGQFLVDMAYVFLDPRIKLEGGSL